MKTTNTTKSQIFTKAWESARMTFLILESHGVSLKECFSKALKQQWELSKRPKIQIHKQKPAPIIVAKPTYTKAQPIVVKRVVSPEVESAKWELLHLENKTRWSRSDSKRVDELNRIIRSA